MKHFVTFFSPGTFVSETNCEKIGAWDVDQAIALARTISQRHGARPFGFRFSTEHRTAVIEDGEPSINIKTINSPMYYIGGKIETIEEVMARNDPNEEILRSNMQMNNIKRVLINTNSYRSTLALDDEDIVLDVSL